MRDGGVFRNSQEGGRNQEKGYLGNDSMKGMATRGRLWDRFEESIKRVSLNSNGELSRRGK